MEHSLLHGLQLLGLLIAIAGPIHWLVLARGLGRPAPILAWERAGLRVSRRAACVAALAASLDVFVQVAETSGQTVFGGVPIAGVVEFLSSTTVGHLALARIVSLLLAAGAFCLPLQLAWPLGLAASLGALLATAAVSHAAALPYDRTFALALQALHLLAVSSWMGVLFHWWLLRDRFLAAEAGCAAFRVALLRRFSPWALLVATLVFASGLLAAVRFLPSLRDLLLSAYGLSLLLKLTLLLPVLWAGYHNFRWIVPALGATSAAQEATLARFRRTLELEVTAGLLVVVVAGIVGSVSPPGNDGAVALNDQQLTGILRPGLPPGEFVDPNAFVGAADRNLFDLQYSEFMHQWAGVFVILMGIVWWLQSLDNQLANWANRIWPALLIPFAAFISYFADPEVFVLRRVSLREAISDPVVVEHQIGALMVLVLVWLGWRDHKRPRFERPLGPALPLLMIAGSLLLLGHAHASVRSTQELTNLINVQHAIMGTIGLLAGTIRWLMLRHLLPEHGWKHVWPALIVALGSSMAFFYEEAL